MKKTKVFEYSSVEKEVDIDEDRPFGNGSDSDSASVLSTSSIKRRKELSTPFEAVVSLLVYAFLYVT